MSHFPKISNALKIFIPKRSNFSFFSLQVDTMYKVQTRKLQLLQKISAAQNGVTSGERLSQKNMDPHHQLQDAVARLYAFKRKSTCAAVFISNEIGVCCLATNENCTEEQAKESWADVFETSKNSYFETYLNIIADRAKCHESKGKTIDESHKSVYGYFSVKQILQLCQLLKQFLEYVPFIVKEFEILGLMDATKLLSTQLGNLVTNLRKIGNEFTNSLKSSYDDAIETAVKFNDIMIAWKHELEKELSVKESLDNLLRRKNGISETIDIIIEVRKNVRLFKKLYEDIETINNSEIAREYRRFSVKSVTEKNINGTVHAELKLVHYLLDKNYLKQPVSLGISKLTCAFCQAYLEIFQKHYGKKVLTTGCHGKVYKGWDFPKNTLLDVAVKTLNLIEKMNDEDEYYVKKSGTDAASSNTS